MHVDTMFAHLCIININFNLILIKIIIIMNIKLLKYY